MADISVGDVDREIIGGVAGTALRDESQIPCSIEAGPGGGRSRDAEADYGN